MRRIAMSLAAAAAALVLAAAAAASCIRMSGAEQRARADIIFDAVALDGPTASGVERFRVVRYRKGTGARTIRVRTGRKHFADGSGMTTSVSITAARGETWRIFARRVRRGLFETNMCDGSRRIRKAG